MNEPYNQYPPSIQNEINSIKDKETEYKKQRPKRLGLLQWLRLTFLLLFNKRT